MSKHISRRTFLHQAVLTGTAALLAACAPSQQENATGPASDVQIPGAQDSTATATRLAARPAVTEGSENGSAAAGCNLEKLVAPTRPYTTPRYTELDKATGLHMTGTVQEIDLAAYRLEVTGRVDRPLSLTLDELRCMPVVSTHEDLFCPGYFNDHAAWSGTPIKYVLDLAGVQKGVKSIQLISGDGHISYPTLVNAMDEKNFLAYSWEDQPLPVLHGFPLRAAFPGIAGDMWTKWLVKLQVD